MVLTFIQRSGQLILVGLIFLSLAILLKSLILLLRLLTVSNRHVYSPTFLGLFLWCDDRIYFAVALLPLWNSGHSVVVIITVQLHSTKPELWFNAGSNPPRSMSEILQWWAFLTWSRLEIGLNVFRWLTISQKICYHHHHHHHHHHIFSFRWFSCWLRGVYFLSYHNFSIFSSWFG